MLHHVIEQAVLFDVADLKNQPYIFYERIAVEMHFRSLAWFTLVLCGIDCCSSHHLVSSVDCERLRECSVLMYSALSL